MLFSGKYNAIYTTNNILIYLLNYATIGLIAYQSGSDLKGARKAKCL